MADRWRKPVLVYRSALARAMRDELACAGGGIRYCVAGRPCRACFERADAILARLGYEEAPRG